jgi:hypothetical protein
MLVASFGALILISLILIRTQTLADGCDYCDFRFKKGAVTQISSKTPEVQDAIERIRDKEAEQGATVDG